MEWIVTTIFTGTAAFVATNIDDIFVLMLFYSQLSATFRRRHVVAVLRRIYNVGSKTT